MRMMRYHLSASAVKAFEQQAQHVAPTVTSGGAASTTTARDSPATMVTVLQAAVQGLGRAPTASDAAVVLLACDRHIGRKPPASRGKSDDRRALAAYSAEAERLMRRLHRDDNDAAAKVSGGVRTAPITTLQAALL
jgi:hypothetical protein